VSGARELLAQAEARLRTAGVPTPRVDAELLLSHVTGRPRALLRLAADPDRQERARFLELVAARARRVPLQHLTGEAPFRHLVLQVGPGVFVPRPETELLVDLVLAHLAGSARPPVVVDLCTGSGALALSLALEVPGSSILAVELHEEALTWARRNVEAHAAELARVGSSVALLAGDATLAAESGGPLREWRGRVDAVVTNPPYVPDEAVPRDPEVRDHDPAQALFGGPDGLVVVRGLVVQAAGLLRPGGLLVVEHSDAQGEQAGPGGVPGLLRAQRDGRGRRTWQAVADHADLGGRPRHTSAIRSGQD